MGMIYIYVYPGNRRSSTTIKKILKDVADAELLLPPDLDIQVDGTIIRIRPGKKLTSHFFSHKGEEQGYLIAGRLEMTIENQSC